MWELREWEGLRPHHKATLSVADSLKIPYTVPLLVLSISKIIEPFELEGTF